MQTNRRKNMKKKEKRFSLFSHLLFCFRIESVSQKTLTKFSIQGRQENLKMKKPLHLQRFGLLADDQIRKFESLVSKRAFILQLFIVVITKILTLKKVPAMNINPVLFIIQNHMRLRGRLTWVPQWNWNATYPISNQFTGTKMILKLVIRIRGLNLGSFGKFRNDC